MLYLASLLLLFVAIARSSAPPGCETSETTSCMTPLLGFMLGPDGKEMNQIKGLEYTEQQLVHYCRYGRTTAECQHDSFDRCATFAPDIRNFFGGMAGLMKGCDQPGFYNKARVMLQCTAALSRSGAKTNACYNTAVRLMKNAIRQLRPTPSFWTGSFYDTDVSRRYSSGRMLDAMCCATKFYKTCSGVEVTDKCGPDAQQMFDDFNKAVLNGFNCSQDRLNRCPPLNDPLPKDYVLVRESIWEYQTDFAEMMRGTMLKTGNTDDDTYTPTNFISTSSSNLLRTSYATIWWALWVHKLVLRRA